MSGWVKIHRKITENRFYFSEPFTKMQAWYDLIILANHKQNTIVVRGVIVDIKRGQTGYSIENLGKRWKWSVGKVKRFLNVLENDQQIVQQKNNVTTLITIVNYNQYQGDDSADSTANDSANDTTDGRQIAEQTDTNKNDKKEKNDKKSTQKDAVVPEWKLDYEVYLKEARDAYSKLIKDEKWMKLQEGFHPNCDIKESVKSCFVNYWTTKERWEDKKSQKIESINWKSTIANSLKYHEVKKKNYGTD